jgi:hypothetical protein
MPVPDGDVLPLLAYLVGGVDVQPDEVLHPVVAVHPSSVLPHLHQPCPDVLGGSPDGDGQRGLLGGIGDELVAGQDRGGLVGSGSPSPPRVQGLHAQGLPRPR